jgi:membrane protein YdbS with pleckstrin-like domain
MNFLNLIKHSFSIIAVFKLAVVLRSTLFVIIYFFLVHQNISTIMLLPIIFVIVMIISIFIISKRENIVEFRNSLKNILVIEELKK